MWQKSTQLQQILPLNLPPHASVTRLCLNTLRNSSPKKPGTFLVHCNTRSVTSNDRPTSTSTLQQSYRSGVNSAVKYGLAPPKAGIGGPVRIREGDSHQC